MTRRHLIRALRAVARWCVVRIHRMDPHGLIENPRTVARPPARERIVDDAQRREVSEQSRLILDRVFGPEGGTS